uniref:Protein kinase domain-containing protein n=1 Tax=Globisporangium ultimum (strain ATCC 200006 / CBS 805.95 / DAOM BR144) TaxID=431595 RepID=K3WW87_GLOUD
MWDNLVKRLEKIYVQMLLRESVPKPSTLQYLMIIFRLIRFCLTCKERTFFTRLVASRSVSDTFQDFHTELDHLLRTTRLVPSDTIGDAWCDNWEVGADNVNALFLTAVDSNDRTVANVKKKADVAEAFALLRHELTSNGDQCNEEKRQLLRTCLTSIQRYATKAKLKLVEPPAWFIPRHEVDFKSQAKTQRSRLHLFRSGRWLKSAVFVSEFTTKRDFSKLVERWHPLKHPHVIEMFGACHLRQPYLAIFEKTSTTYLREYLRMHENRHLVWNRLYEVARGLKYLHSKGVILGKLRCDRILIGSDGVAKIAECGFEPASEDSQIDDEDVRWRAPECLNKCGDPTELSDVYCLGMLILDAVSSIDDFTDSPFRVTGWSQDDRRDWLDLMDGMFPLSENQWSLVRRMCCFDLFDRVTLEYAVEHLKEFAARETDQLCQSTGYGIQVQNMAKPISVDVMFEKELQSFKVRLLRFWIT